MNPVFIAGFKPAAGGQRRGHVANREFATGRSEIHDSRPACQTALVSADGRFVYAGNRLHDSVAIFSVGLDGRLTFVTEEWTRGNDPRSFNFDPTGEFLYVCNQRADHVTAFRVNRTTGALTFTGHYTLVGNPSAILFLDLARTK